MKSKLCKICNTSSANDEVQILLSKKIPKTSLVKVVSIQCCHNCKEFVSRQNKRVWKAKWTIFFISLVFLAGIVLFVYLTGNMDMLALWSVFSALGASVLTDIVYSFFFSVRYEKIERQECDAAGMQYIGDFPEIQEYLARGYRIKSMY